MSSTNSYIKINNFTLTISNLLIIVKALLSDRNPLYYSYVIFQKKIINSLKNIGNSLTIFYSNQLFTIPLFKSFIPTSHIYFCLHIHVPITPLHQSLDSPNDSSALIAF